MQTKAPITYADFEKLDIRVGTITAAKPFEKARKAAYQLWVDFGELGIKKSSAQITQGYGLSEVVGKQVIAVVNFPPKQIADFMSECLVLGVVDGQSAEVILLTADKPSKNGDCIA